MKYTRLSCIPRKAFPDSFFFLRGKGGSHLTALGSIPTQVGAVNMFLYTYCFRSPSSYYRGFSRLPWVASWGRSKDPQWI